MIQPCLEQPARPCGYAVAMGEDSLQNQEMAKGRTKARVTKEQWLQKALELFAREGEPGVRIEQLAREIGVAKAGFYWHFKDRADLLRQLLDFWAHEYTEVITQNNALAAMPAKERMLTTMRMIHDHDLAGLDVHFHVWARKDAGVARKVRQVMLTRLNYLRQCFADAGFEGDELEMRARLFTVYHSNEKLLLKHKSKQEAERYRELQCKLLLDLD